MFQCSSRLVAKHQPSRSCSRCQVGSCQALFTNCLLWKDDLVISVTGTPRVLHCKCMVGWSVRRHRRQYQMNFSDFGGSVPDTQRAASNGGDVALKWTQLQIDNLDSSKQAFANSSHLDPSGHGHGAPQAWHRTSHLQCFGVLVPGPRESRSLCWLSVAIV